MIVVTCDWDCNNGINNPNGVFSGVTVQLVVRTDRVTPQDCTSGEQKWSSNTNIVQYYY
jgi:hypothetical protein